MCDILGGFVLNKDFLVELGIDEDIADTILNRHCAEVNGIHIRNSVRQELMTNGVKSIDAAMKLFDFDGLEVSGSEVIGLDKKLSTFITDNSFLFESNEVPVFSAPSNGGVHGDISREEFSKMGYSQRLKLFNENPELYSQLKN